MDDTVRVQPLSDRAITLTRVLNAPRALVFAAWTEEDHFACWWGPDGFVMTSHEIDVRTGGAWRFTMRGPDGTDYKNKIVYVEVAPPERLAYLHAGEEAEDRVKFLVTVIFAEDADKTRLTMQMVFDSAEARDHVIEKLGAIGDAGQSLHRLEQHLARLPA